MTRALQEVRRTDEEFSTLQTGATFGVDEIRESLGTDAVLLEYYQARGQLYVCVLRQKDLDIVPLGPIWPVFDIVAYCAYCDCQVSVTACPAAVMFVGLAVTRQVGWG